MDEIVISAYLLGHKVLPVDALKERVGLDFRHICLTSSKSVDRLFIYLDYLFIYLFMEGLRPSQPHRVTSGPFTKSNFISYTEVEHNTKHADRYFMFYDQSTVKGHIRAKQNVFATTSKILIEETDTIGEVWDKNEVLVVGRSVLTFFHASQEYMQFVCRHVCVYNYKCIQRVNPHQPWDFHQVPSK